MGGTFRGTMVGRIKDNPPYLMHAGESDDPSYEGFEPFHALLQFSWKCTRRTMTQSKVAVVKDEPSYLAASPSDAAKIDASR